MYDVGLAGAAGAASSQTLVPMLGEEIAKLDIPVELKQTLVAAVSAAIGAATGGAAGPASGLNATANNYLTATDLRSKAQKLSGCQASNDVGKCEIAVLKEDELQNAKNSASIDYKSVLSEGALRGEKEQLERLLQDPSMSDSTKAEARKSINELNVAITRESTPTRVCNATRAEPPSFHLSISAWSPLVFAASSFLPA